MRTPLPENKSAPLVAADTLTDLLGGGSRAQNLSNGQERWRRLVGGGGGGGAVYTAPH